jgi:antitoxin YefM
MRFSANAYQRESLNSGKSKQTMQSTYRLNANELSLDFVEAVKKLYKDRTITIFISEETEVDETQYLMRSEANRRHLLQAIQDVKEGKNLMPVDLQKLKAEMLK